MIPVDLFDDIWCSLHFCKTVISGCKIKKEVKLAYKFI